MKHNKYNVKVAYFSLRNNQLAVEQSWGKNAVEVIPAYTWYEFGLHHLYMYHSFCRFKYFNI